MNLLKLFSKVISTLGTASLNMHLPILMSDSLERLTMSG